MNPSLFFTIIHSLGALFVVCLLCSVIGVQTGQGAVKYSFKLASVVVFTFLVFVFLLDYYLAYGKKLQVISIITSVFPLLAIMALAVYFIYLYVAFSSRIISEKVDFMFYIYDWAQLLLLSVCTYVVVAFTETKANFVNPLTGSAWISSTMLFLVVAALMYLLDDLMNTTLTLYRADG